MNESKRRLKKRHILFISFHRSKPLRIEKVVIYENKMSHEEEEVRVKKSCIT